MRGTRTAVVTKTKGMKGTVIAIAAMKAGMRRAVGMPPMTR